MSDDNFRLNRFEELFDYIEELTRTDDPDLQEVAITSLQAMINDQLAFVKNQFDSGRLPSEQAQESMRLLETPFVYGYLLGAGTYVGAVVGEEPGGTASIDAMRRAFAELYLDNGERNWKASQAVPEDDLDYATGIDAGGEDLRRFLSRFRGEDLGPSNAIASFIHDRLMSVESTSELAGNAPLGDPPSANSPGQGVAPSDPDARITELLATMSSPKRYAKLETDELSRLIREATVLYGIHGDERLRNMLDVLYPLYRDEEEESSRLHDFYRTIVNAIEEGLTSHEAIRVFLLHDDSPALVSTAALDFAVYHPLVNGDPMTGPNAVLDMFNENNVDCRAGLFKGLMLLGDDRVFDLLRELRRELTPLEAQIVCGPGSGYIFGSMVEFLIDWLEEAEADEDEGTYGLIAAALGNLPRTANAPVVVAGRRRFPVDPNGETLEDGFKKIPLEEFAESIEPRLGAIAEREPPPQIMPLVLGAWGLEP